MTTMQETPNKELADLVAALWQEIVQIGHQDAARAGAHWNDGIASQVRLAALSVDCEHLIDAAAASLPLTTELEPAILPFASGLVACENRAVSGNIESPGLMWSRRRDGTGVVLTILVRRDGELWLPFFFWPYGEPLDKVVLYQLSNNLINPLPVPITKTSLQSYTAYSSFLRFSMALWLFMQQRLLVEDETEPTRALRRRMERQRQQNKTISIIRLRRQMRSHPKTGEQHPVDWAYRWLVSGHWRQQPYRTQGGKVKTIWIAPYVKGPDDKPFQTKERRYVIVQ